MSLNPIKCAVAQLNQMPLILYGAGENARLTMPFLDQAGAQILCFCDADIAKQGKEYRGYPVVGIAQAQEQLAENSKVMIYITPVLFTSQIIRRSLIEQSDFTEEQILNSYIPMQRRKSCEQLESALMLDEAEINACCNVQYLKASSLCDPYQSADVVVDQYLSARKQLIEQNQTENAPCQDCPCFIEADWQEEFVIKAIQFNDHSVCQLRCCYCSNTRQGRNQKPRYDTSKIIERLGELGHLSDSLTVTIGNGEFTIDPKRKQIQSFVERRHAAFFMFSNAVIYDPELCQLLIQNKSSFLNVSLDSGTAETYQAIKGIPAFEKVVHNLKNYCESGVRLVLKYIFVEANKNFKDVSGFIDLCKSLRPIQVSISSDLYKADDLAVSESTLFWVRAMELLCKEAGLESEISYQFMGKNTALEYKRRYQNASL